MNKRTQQILAHYGGEQRSKDFIWDLLNEADSQDIIKTTFCTQPILSKIFKKHNRSVRILHLNSNENAEKIIQSILSLGRSKIVITHDLYFYYIGFKDPEFLTVFLLQFSNYLGTCSDHYIFERLLTIDLAEEIRKEIDKEIVASIILNAGIINGTS